MGNIKKVTFAGLALTTAFSLTVCNSDACGQTSTPPSNIPPLVESFC